MTSGLTELGLNLKDDAGAGKSREAGAAAARAASLASFLVGLIDVVGAFAPSADEADLDTFRRSLRGYRATALDPHQQDDLESAAASCVAACAGHLQAARAHVLEREQEWTELVSILQEAARLSLGDSAEFSAAVLAASGRVETIAELGDIRDLRRRLGEEVSGLRRAVVEKQEREGEAFRVLTRRVETLQSRLSELEVEVALDPLTKIGNRGSFDRALAQLGGAARRKGTPLGLALIDVDHFKQINDTHGHPIGDRVLLCLAQKLTSAVRQGDVVARYGGEEFAILMPGIVAREAEERFHRLLAEIAASTFSYGAGRQEQHVRFTVSCGLTHLQPTDSDADLVSRADGALYDAKRRGRNRVVTRKPSLLDRMLGKSA